MILQCIVLYTVFRVILCNICPDTVSCPPELAYPLVYDPVEILNSEVYKNMYTYAHLIDIAYCVSPTSHIQQPFKCDINCEERFPNMTLIYQWYFDDSVAGYIATTYSNIFNYDTTVTPKKTVVVSLRGTYSILDSYTDIKVDMVSYNNLGTHLRSCGSRCKVHRGFYSYYLHTLLQIDDILKQELQQDDYELLIVGHSLGGSVALLLGLYYLDLGYDKMTLITMGQPLLGNQPFVNWVDEVMGSAQPVVHNSYARKFFRVIHRNDIVSTIPTNGNVLEPYYQFDNQIYLNCSSAETKPSNDQVIDCHSADQPECIRKDFKGLLDRFTHNYLQTHTHYFRTMGFCGIHLVNANLGNSSSSSSSSSSLSNGIEFL